MAAIGGQSQRRRIVRGRILFGVSFLVALILFFAAQANDRILDRTQSEASDVAAKIMTYVTMPVRGLENMAADFQDLTQAHEENKRLKEELRRLSDLEARSNALAIKLSRFETILNVDVTSGIPEQKVAARSVAENDGPFVRSTLLNAGADKGIRKGYAVMTFDGLLGHVVSVGRNSARVLKLEDLNSRVSVMTLRSQSRAILTGDNSRLPKLSFITEDSDWADSDVVITSGDDGVLPQGLPIGFVTKDENGDFRVRLYVNDNHVDWVWVYPYDGPLAPEADPVADPLTANGADAAPAGTEAENAVETTVTETAANTETANGDSAPTDNLADDQSPVIVDPQ